MMKTPNLIFLLLLLGMTPSVASAQRTSRKAGGADSEEGWIIRRTKNGVVKVPKKQKFRFEGSDVSGNVERPSQSVLGARVPRKNTSLIPVRTSFREEALAVSGLSDR
jgi:hypothetical protein